MSSKNSLPPGTQLGRYKILLQLGVGGMGEVYLAEDTKLNRRVAIKLLPADSLESENANRRLLREAQSAAKLDHPNICAIHEVSEEDGRNFICMQYVEGETLEARMKRDSLAKRASLDLSESLAIAMRPLARTAICSRHVPTDESGSLFVMRPLARTRFKSLERAAEETVSIELNRTSADPLHI